MPAGFARRRCVSGTTKLPFAGYSAGSLQEVDLGPSTNGRSDIWALRRRTQATDFCPARVSGHPPALIQCSRGPTPARGGLAHSRSAAAAGAFPVVIGEGSHPFPFRTRKLSPLPPMVLRAQVRGRVGHCREYSSEPAERRAFSFAARVRQRLNACTHPHGCCCPSAGVSSPGRRNMRAPGNRCSTLDRSASSSSISASIRASSSVSPIS